MIIPIRCFTCGKVLGDKWNAFVEERKKNLEDEDGEEKETMTEKGLAFSSSNGSAKILNKYGLKRLCCRRHMLGHVDLIEQI
tara:strand:+ start:379 stop:624 length:246 start_codon:yes stop_codon:yes gene_type:complete